MDFITVVVAAAAAVALQVSSASPLLLLGSFSPPHNGRPAIRSSPCFYYSRWLRRLGEPLFCFSQPSRHFLPQPSLLSAIVQSRHVLGLSEASICICFAQNGQKQQKPGYREGRRTVSATTQFEPVEFVVSAQPGKRQICSKSTP